MIKDVWVVKFAVNNPQQMHFRMEVMKPTQEQAVKCMNSLASTYFDPDRDELVECTVIKRTKYFKEVA